MEEYANMNMDQLMERQKLVYKKYMTAASSGASQVLLDQMITHLDAIKLRMWEIGYQQTFDAQNKSESDPFKDSIV